jgi:hypothetical protein
MRDKAFVVDFNEFPPMFPSHRHHPVFHPVFWEKLGRAIGTFGFLEEVLARVSGKEEVLGKAIFAFTATTPYNENDIQAALERWLPTLENALIDPLVITPGRLKRIRYRSNGRPKGRPF